MTQGVVFNKSYESALATNKVLRNTYFLLSLTFLFSAATATYAMVSNAAPIGFIGMLVGMFGLYFLTTSLRNSGWGILAIFAFTGFLGYSLGPVLNAHIAHYVNGKQLIMTSLGATGMIFLGLSAYALSTRKDFNYLGGFIAVASMTAFVAAIAGFIFHMPILQLFVSGAFVLISSGYILYTTSQIINGGEKNYIMAAITLYIAIFNLFVSLLRILGAFAGISRD